MCPPVIAIAAAATSIAGSVAGKIGQDKAAAANKNSATNAMLESWKDIDQRQMQEQDATNVSIMGADKQARNRAAIAATSAGESGVAGQSVDALLSTFDNDASANKVMAQHNLDAQNAQYQAEKRGSQAQAQSRINAVQPGNWMTTGLQIAGAGLNAAGSAAFRTPPKG